MRPYRRSSTTVLWWLGVQYADLFISDVNYDVIWWVSIMNVTNVPASHFIFLQVPLYDTDPAVSDQTDFISLELREGYPRLRINLGDEQATLDVTGKNAAGEDRIRPLNDGRWHTIEVMKTNRVRKAYILKSFLHQTSASTLRWRLGHSSHWPQWVAPKWVATHSQASPSW